MELGHERKVFNILLPVFPFIHFHQWVTAIHRLNLSPTSKYGIQQMLPLTTQQSCYHLIEKEHDENVSERTSRQGGVIKEGKKNPE